METFHWKKLGSWDPPHFDYKGSGGIDIRTLSVKAFQRLYNRHNPTKKLAEDGLYGHDTENALMNVRPPPTHVFPHTHDST